MLPDEVRSRVDSIWDRIWASGVSNPLTAIEYFSTILILKRLGDRESTCRPSAESLWSQVEFAVNSCNPEGVATLMKTVQAEFGIGASPEVASATMWHDLATLRRVLTDVEALEISDRNHDILGDLFEYMLNHLSTAGHFGQFRTPRHLIKFMVEVVSPQPGEVVVDPACGTGGFLIAAHQYRHGTPNEAYIGNEVDASIGRVAQTNVRLHDMNGADIRLGDSFQAVVRDADVILANPPFAGAVLPERVSDFRSGTLKTELLFVELMMRRLRQGGRAGVVVPTGVLTSSAASAVWIRQQLLEMNALQAVVELPSGVFRPYTGVKTALLFWSNARCSDDVLMIRIASDGYSLDDRRRPVDSDDLAHALRLLRGLSGSGIPHVQVSANEIVESGYVLSPSRYLPSERDSSEDTDQMRLADSLHSARRAVADLLSALSDLEGTLR